MSTINSKNVQVGTSGVANQNFTLYQPATPDGTVRLGVGNTGATTLDAVTVTNAGNATVSGTVTATTFIGAVTGGAVTATSLAVSGATTTSTLAVNGNNISAVQSLGFRNRIINGDMRIDQRNAGAAVTTDAAYPVDRFYMGKVNDGAFSAQRSTTAPAGFTNSLQFTTTAADSSLAAGQFQFIVQRIEGFNIADLGWGAAGAQSVTLSFWVRSSLTGTFGGALQNNGASRSYPFTYTINAANTWEFETITIPGDTSGTWLTNSGNGISLVIGLGVGSTYSGTAGAWASADLQSATGAVSVIGTNGATFYITGIQLEAGSVATPFERRDYGRELMMCQRYAVKYTNENLGLTLNNSTAYSPHICFPVQMRATPTIESGATYSVSSGTAGTVSFIPGLPWAGATSLGGSFGNPGNNWSSAVFVSVTAVLTSEI
jgi:hypothetical protein